MSASFPYRPRRLFLLLALAAPLGGCGTVTDFVGPAFVDPGRYDLWDCKQLGPERKALATRLADLQRLMDKAETGTGGFVVSELAYRNDYISVRAQQNLLEDTWKRDRCRDSDMDPQKPAATPVPLAPATSAKPAPASKSGSAVY